MNLYCERLPNRADSDVLFIHGNLASARWWKPTLEHWPQSSGSGSLLTADWRGCGRNPDWHSDRQFTIQDLAQDFFELLDRERLDKVQIVGHSLGGLIALQMMILQPERFTKSVLLDPVGAEGVVFDDSMYEAFRQMALNRDLTRTVILSTILNADEALSQQMAEEFADDAFKAVKGIGSSVLEILKSINLSDDARSVQTPTLILHGQQDMIIPLKDSEKLASLMPSAKLEILNGVGHCWNVENPARFTERIHAWLKG